MMWAGDRKQGINAGLMYLLEYYSDMEEGECDIKSLKKRCVVECHLCSLMSYYYLQSPTIL